MNQIIAEREIFAVTPEGEKKKFHIILNKPFQVDDVSWACQVQIKEMHKNLLDVKGHDSWQALGLALSLVHQLLRYFLEDGGKLYWEEGGDEMSLSDLFPHFAKRT